MWQMYGSLVEYIRSGIKSDRVDIRFVDVTSNDIDNYPLALAYLRKGYAIPLVSINGIISFYGGLPYEQIYRVIEKCIQSQYIKF